MNQGTSEHGIIKGALVKPATVSPMKHSNQGRGVYLSPQIARQRRHISCGGVCTPCCMLLPQRDRR